MSKPEKTYTRTEEAILVTTGVTLLVAAMSFACAAAMYWWGGAWRFPMGLGAGSSVLFVCFFVMSMAITS